MSSTRDTDPDTVVALLYRLVSEPGCTLGAVTITCPLGGVLVYLADPLAELGGLPVLPTGFVAGVGALLLGALLRRVRSWRALPPSPPER